MPIDPTGMRTRLPTRLILSCRAPATRGGLVCYAGPAENHAGLQSKGGASRPSRPRGRFARPRRSASLVRRATPCPPASMQRPGAIASARRRRPGPVGAGPASPRPPASARNVSTWSLSTRMRQRRPVRPAHRTDLAAHDQDDLDGLPRLGGFDQSGVHAGDVDVLAAHRDHPYAETRRVPEKWQPPSSSHRPASRRRPPGSFAD